MNNPVEKKLEVVSSFLRREITIGKACSFLSCTPRTFLNLRKRFFAAETDGLKDKRTGHNLKLKDSERQAVIALKDKDRWRSARNVRDTLCLAVSVDTIGRMFKKAGLVKINRERVKPVQAFEAACPNDLWQTDIMGKIIFPNIGELYLIATLDDHSRFVPYGEWFASQHKAHVFIVWYQSLKVAGIPKAMLQDRGSQYKANGKIGTADYQQYAQKLKIELIFARRVQTKGKIERFWKFVQRDFVPSVMGAQSKDKVNEKWRLWLKWYNDSYRSAYFGNKTHRECWAPGRRMLPPEELDELLTVWERRTVSLYNTISLYGVYYRLPPGYARCRIWIKIIGNVMYFQSMNKLFHKTKLRFK